MKLLQGFLALTSFTPFASSHMQLNSPIPLDHADPDNNRPLRNDGSDYPCKGLVHKAQDANASLTWTAGETASFSLKGGAIHGGGSCQASLSVDGGQTFRVVHSWLGNCPRATDEHSFDFRVPADTPDTKNAIFSWSWLNRWGNREYYQDCAAVDIKGRRGGRGGGKKEHDHHAGKEYNEVEHEHGHEEEHSSFAIPISSNSSDQKSSNSTNHNSSCCSDGGHPSQETYANNLNQDEAESYTAISFHERPHIFIANIEGITNCKTIEGKPVKFPHPGPDVTSDGSVTADPVGNCQGPPGGDAAGDDSSSSTPSPALTSSKQAQQQQPTDKPDYSGNEPEATSTKNEPFRSSTKKVGRPHATPTTTKPGNASSPSQDYKPGNDEWPKDFIHASGTSAASGGRPLVAAYLVVSGLALLFVVLL